MNLSPDGGGEIQRRLFVNFQADYDNSSPSLLTIYALIYGLKDNTNHDIDISIYDFEKYFEITSFQYFTMHMPINMSNQRIINLGSPTDSNDAVSKTSLSSTVKDSYIFGAVTKSTYITNDGGSYNISNAFTSNRLIINFSSINIKSITLYNKDKYINKTDVVSLNYEDLGGGNFRSRVMRFQFKSQPIKFLINMVTKILFISLYSTTDIKFKLVYQAVDV